MDITNIYMLVAAIIERANIDVGLVTVYNRENRGGQSTIPRVCTHGDTEHAARICARLFLNKVYALRESNADHTEIAMEILSWRL